MSFSFSLIGPASSEAGDRAWTVFCGGTQELQGTTYSTAYARLTRYVTASKRVRPIALWVRTAPVAEAHKICPIVWTNNRRMDGPGYGAMCIGPVQIKDLLSTVEAHAQMMLL